MPRGFLVKRFKDSSPPTKEAAETSSSNSLLIHKQQKQQEHCDRIHKFSDEDRSDSSSDHETLESRLFCGALSVGPEDLTKHSTGAHFSAEASLSAENSVLSPTRACEDEPLALTTNGRKRGGVVSGSEKLFQAIRNSVLLLPRAHNAHDVLQSTPPLERKVLVNCHTAPAQLFKKSSPHTPKSYPSTKKRLVDTVPSNGHRELKTKFGKRHKVIRRLNFDEDKSSPVSGTFIKDFNSEEKESENINTAHPSEIRRGDIDPSFNVVLVTDEAKAELAKIENIIGEYRCRLCKEEFSDAFGLASHRCSRIANIVYSCPECQKVFNCPANLASHRRWHRPRPIDNAKNNGSSASKQPASVISVAKLSSDTFCKKQDDDKNEKVFDGFTTDQSDSDSHGDAPSPEKVTRKRLFKNSSSRIDLKCQFCSKSFQAYFILRNHILTHLAAAENAATVEDDIKNCSNSRLSVSPPPLTIDMDKVMEDDGTDVSCPASGENKEVEKHLSREQDMPARMFSFSGGLIRHAADYHPNQSRNINLFHMNTARPLST